VPQPPPERPITRLDARARRREGQLALQIDDVVARPDGPADLRVEVTGHWRQSPFEPDSIPVLVIDDGRRSHRFTAVPFAAADSAESASAFEATFVVPAALGARLVAPLVLLVGAVAIPLPDARLAAPGEPAEDGPLDPVAIAERRARRAEEAEQVQLRRAARAQTEVRRLQAAVGEMDERLTETSARHQAEVARLAESLAEREREARVAAQRAHAEQHRREERETETGDRTRRLVAKIDALRLAAQEAQTRALTVERELERVSRAEAEARHAAAAATVARADAERRLVEGRRRAEREVAGALVQRAGLEQRARSLERESGNLRIALEEERLVREQAVAALIERLSRQRADHAEDLAQLHRQVTILHEQMDRTGAPIRDDAPVADASAGRHLAGRLPWLADGAHRLAAEDPEAAARLALELLHAQRSDADAGPVDYDLELRPLGWFRVRARPGGARVDPLERPRARRERDLRLRGDARAVAALLAQGGAAPRRHGLRSSLGPRARRARERLEPAQLDLCELAAAGALPDPVLAFRALAARIDPDWTTGHSFTVAQELSDGTTVFVTVDDGAPIEVTGERPPHVDARVYASPIAWARALSGHPPEPGDRPSTRGSFLAVSLLDRWTQWARSGPLGT